MDVERVRTELREESERVSAELAGSAGERDLDERRPDELRGYRRGLEYALELLGAPPTSPAYLEDLPGPDVVLDEELTRVRSTEG